MENFNTKRVITRLLTNNLITGRITTNPCEYKKDLQVQMSFDDVMLSDNNVALLYDTDADTRAELTGVFKLPLNLIEEAHFTEDFLEYGDLYGKYNVLIYLGENLDKEILITFDMKNKTRSPYVIDNEDALEYSYATEAVTQLNYFLDKPVKINLSGMSYLSTYDPDNCNYANPVFATMEIKAFQYEFKLNDCIPCVTITDKDNKNVQLTLNAIGCIHECNVGESDKRIFHVNSEIGLISIMDEGYVFPNEREVA